MRLKKYQIKIILILVLFLSLISKGHAIERAGLIGQSWSFPVFFDPKRSFKEITYHFDTAYFMNENWSAFLAIDTQVKGLQLFYLEFGPDYYPLNDTFILPFVSGRFLYSMVPNGDVGWLANLGFETKLASSFQIENLKLRVSTGGGQIFIKHDGHSAFLELIRVGLVWCF